MSLIRIGIFALAVYLYLSGLLTWSVVQRIELPESIQQLVVGPKNGD